MYGGYSHHVRRPSALCTEATLTMHRGRPYHVRRPLLARADAVRIGCGLT
ncbi:MAG: hypothetical protein K2I86_02955 [Prevotella sp.]|nr:hypothetical protein [Prevotella sp.]